jgi:ribosomal protein L22
VDAQGLRRAWYRRERVRGSYKKLLLLARQVRGMSAVEAMAHMTFSQKKRAEDLRYVIYRAATKAEFYHEMDPNDLLVEQVFLEKGAMRRVALRFHARGRFAMNKIWDTKVKVVVREMTAQEKQTLLKFPVASAAAKAAAAADKADKADKVAAPKTLPSRWY